ncbi:MAG: thiol-disulfide oxidoreductase DCC family protein [Bdellovibrio sp.]|nr:thiol-disulfide oxidoreductase DCC family protein [Bdellovibrio sp.]
MKRIIFFDGVCSLCNGFIDFILKRDQKKAFEFSSLQSQFARKILPPQNLSLDSIVLLEDQKVYTNSTAVLRILFEIGGGWNLFAVLASILPVWLRDRIYQTIARNRYKLFGKKDTCRLPSPEEKNRFLE